MDKENWSIIAKKADFAGLGKECGIDPVMARILVNRGLDTPQKINKYLHADLSDLYEPELMKDLTKAADIITEAINHNEKIMIVADYDADGIFSGRLLYEGLTSLGADAFTETPHRIKDGYGVNERIIRVGEEKGASLLVTCDNGISAASAIKLANSLGMKCVVTDHHEVPYEDAPEGRKYILPDALAVVDPKRSDCPYSYKGLCGCGVVLKLITYMFNKAGRSIPDLYYEYAAIATICDVMPLDDENRIIVKEGLKRIKNTKSKGISALIRECQLDKENISAYHVGFVLGPCFNAAGRLESVDPAINLLAAQTEDEADKYAAKLRNLNESRKALTEEGTEKAMAIIESSELINDKIILAAVPDTHESIAGIIAGRLREKYNKPCFVFTKTETCYKGSGRSIPAYHMHEGLTKCKEHILAYGGHSQAAGLSVAFDELDKLRAELNAGCTLTEEDFALNVKIDVPMPISYITEDLINQLELLEPCGTENERPVFAENHLGIRSAGLIGKNKNILRMSLVNAEGYIMDAVMFSRAEQLLADIDEKYGEGVSKLILSHRENPVDAGFVYYPSVNDYMGVKTLQIIVQRYRLN